MWLLVQEIAQKLGVWTNVPFRALTAQKVYMVYQIQKTGEAGKMDFA